MGARRAAGLRCGIGMGAALLSAALAAAQEPRAIPPDQPLADTEWVGRAARISGDVLAGAIFAAAPSQEPPALFARVPLDWAGTRLCVRVVTLDGLYEAERGYTVPPDWPGGRAQFLYPTDYRDRLAGSYLETGVTITRAACDEESPVHLVAYWNDAGTATAEEILLLVNSFRADEVYLFVGDDPAAPAIDCAVVEAEQRTSFDFRCSIPLDQARGGEFTVELNRLRSGQPDPPRLYTLTIGSE